MSIPTAAANRHQRWGLQQNPTICGAFKGALGRTRTCDLLIRSQTRSRTRGDREGHRETKQRFYRQLSTSRGTGTDRERHGVVVPLWYERPLTYSIGGGGRVP